VLLADGALRLSALSPTLLRLERRGPLGFEDELTFLAENRSGWAADEPMATLGSPVAGADGTINVTVSSGTAESMVVVITPHHLDGPAEQQCWTNAGPMGLFPAAAGPGVHVADAGGCCDACDALPNCSSWLFNKWAPPNVSGQLLAGSAGAPGVAGKKHSSCSTLTNDTDVNGPAVIKGNESLQCNMTLSACCAACNAEPECAAFVLAAPSSWAACPHQPYCFILKSFKGTHAKTGSIMGTKGGIPTPPPTPPAPPDPEAKP